MNDAVLDEKPQNKVKAQVKMSGAMALVMLGIILLPVVAAIAGGVVIFTAPAVAALGFVPQLGIAVAGGLGIGFVSRIVTTVASIPLLGYLALKRKPVIKLEVSEADARAGVAAAANTNTPAAKVEATKPAAEFKQAAGGVAQPAADQTIAQPAAAPKAAPKAAKKAG